METPTKIKATTLMIHNLDSQETQTLITHISQMNLKPQVWSSGSKHVVLLKFRNPSVLLRVEQQVKKMKKRNPEIACMQKMNMSDSDNSPSRCQNSSRVPTEQSGGNLRERSHSTDKSSDEEEVFPERLRKLLSPQKFCFPPKQSKTLTRIQQVFGDKLKEMANNFAHGNTDTRFNQTLKRK